VLTVFTLSSADNILSFIYVQCPCNVLDVAASLISSFVLINSSGISFLIELGRRLTDVSGDARETMYLFQRVSLAVQRYNSVAFKGTLQFLPNWTSVTPANLVLTFVFNPRDLY